MHVKTQSAVIPVLFDWFIRTQPRAEEAICREFYESVKWSSITYWVLSSIPGMINVVGKMDEDKDGDPWTLLLTWINFNPSMD